MMKSRLNGVAGAAVAAFLTTLAFTAGAYQTIAYWPFGDKGLTDATGNGNDLEADANVTLGESAVLNGKQTLFSTKSGLSLGFCEAVTVEFWTRFKASENPGAAFFLELSEQTAFHRGAFYVDFNEAENAIMGMGRGVDNMGAEESPVIGFGDGEWHHVAFVLQPTVLSEKNTTLYIDGTNVYTHSYKYGAHAVGNYLFPNGCKLYIGSRNNSSLKFTGEIDNVRLSSGALTPAEFIGRNGETAPSKTIAYWPFGSAGLTDASGHGHDLIAAGAGRLKGGAAAFDGTGEPMGTRLAIDLRPYTHTGFTAELLFRQETNAPTSTQLLLEQAPNSTTPLNGYMPFYIDLNEGGARVRSSVRVGDGYHQDLGKGETLNDGRWHHVALVYTPTTREKGYETFRLYLDGQEQEQDPSGWLSVTNFTALANQPLFIGGRSENTVAGQCVPTGEIDDVRLTAEALDPTRFHTVRSEEDAKVLGWWRFDRGAETAGAVSGVPAITAAGAVAFANGAPTLSGGSLAATLDLGAAEALTAECFVRRSGETAWRHLVKKWRGTLSGEPAAVTVDGESAEPTDWADALVLGVDGAFTAATTAFAGEIDDVRVTAADLADGALLPVRTDDSPVTLAHWSFTGRRLLYAKDDLALLTTTTGGDPGYGDVVDQTFRKYHGMGVRTALPLQLAHWNALTIECFIRTRTPDSNILELGGNYNNAIGAFCLSTSMYMQRPGFGFRTAKGFNICTKIGSVADGNWHHYAYTLERRDGRLEAIGYIDGVAAETLSVHSHTEDTPFRNDYLNVGIRYEAINAATWDNIASFDGDIDEIRIVNAALKPEEMMTLEDRRAQNATTIAHWTFDGEEPLADKSGNGHALTGTAEVGGGVATFTGTTSLQTAEPLVLSDRRRVTFEMVFRTESPETTTILYETSANYNETPGSIVTYLNGNGSIEGGVRGLVRRSDTASVGDTNWHRLAVQYDMDATIDSNYNHCRFFLDGGEVSKIWSVHNDKLLSCTNFVDAVLYLGARGGSSLFFTGQIKEVRVSDGIVAAEDQLKCPAPETAERVVAYWPFDAADPLADKSGNGYALAPAGGVSFTSPYGAADFAKDHAALITTGKVNFAALDSFTVECFVRLDGEGDPATLPGILGTSQTFNKRTCGFNFSTFTNASERLTVCGAVTCGGFYTGQPGKYYGGWIYNNPVFTAGKNAGRRWHHIALVVDRSVGTFGQARFYYDRELVGQKDLPCETVFPASQMAIGSVLGNSQMLVGQIDDVRISSIARTPDTFLQRRSSISGSCLLIR